MTFWKIGPRLAAAALLCCTALAVRAEAEEKPAPEVEWTNGPATVDVGGSLAQIELPEGLAFTGAAGTKDLLRYMGNPTDGGEEALVLPARDDGTWFVVFEWDSIGYVKDDEKDEIDADALLESIRDATEEGNAKRKDLGGSGLHVTGWAEPPHYDARTHNLTWALLARSDDGHEVVNYNVRVLGRTGVMSVTLVEDPQRLAAAKPEVEKLLGAFSYKQGKKYAEWVPGDKVAAVGLTALVAAGAGAAAGKLGLFAVLGKIFAKAGKAIVAVFVALGAVVARFWNALRGKASARPARPSGPGTLG